MTFDPTHITEDEVDAAWIALHGAREIGGRILGFDLGGTFAWAHADRGKILDSGWYNTVRRGEGSGMARLRFKRAIRDLLNTMQPTAVWYEKAEGRFRGHGGKNVIAQIGILEAELTEMKIPYGCVHQAELKSFATGRGNASKEAMREALAARFPGT